MDFGVFLEDMDRHGMGCGDVARLRRVKGTCISLRDDGGARVS